LRTWYPPPVVQNWNDKTGATVQYCKTSAVSLGTAKYYNTGGT